MCKQMFSSRGLCAETSINLPKGSAEDIPKNPARKRGSFGGEVSSNGKGCHI